MRVCPKCSEFYAADASGFCHKDGVPLIDLAPGSDDWNAGQRAIEKTNNTVRKKQRRIRIRRIVFTTMAMLVLTRIVYVVAVKGVVHTDDRSKISESPTPTRDPSPSPTVSPSPNHLGDDEKRTPTPTPTPTPLYKIDGQIKYQNGKPVVIEVQLRGKQSSQIKTDGNYSFAQLPAGDYTVTPRSDGMNFEPRSRDVHLLTENGRADFIASEAPPQLYKIEGQIKFQNSKPLVIEVWLQGKQSFKIKTDGNYSFPLLPAGDYTVTPISDRMNFEPPKRPVRILNKDERADFLGIPHRIEKSNGPALSHPTVDPAPGPTKPSPKIKPRPE
jgi:hypothetical protein